jgi:hypothetical protein
LYLPAHERLFYPFWELWTGANLANLGTHQTFGKLPDYDNDANSDLYNTLNRHYTPSGGWLTARGSASTLSNSRLLISVRADLTSFRRSH